MNYMQIWEAEVLTASCLSQGLSLYFTLIEILHSASQTTAGNLNYLLQVYYLLGF